LRPRCDVQSMHVRASENKDKINFLTGASSP
jgi:hypothetical protein